MLPESKLRNSFNSHIVRLFTGYRVCDHDNDGKLKTKKSSIILAVGLEVLDFKKKVDLHIIIMGTEVEYKYNFSIYK